MLRRTWYGNADMMITTTTTAKNWFSIEKHRIQILWKIEIKTTTTTTTTLENECK